MAKYRCYGVEARLDGSGMVSWDIEAVDKDEGAPIPGHHGTVLTPQDETDVALAAGVPEVKDLLRKYAPGGWDDEALDDEVDANRAATVTADSVDDFIDGYGGYPIDFNLGAGEVTASAAPRVRFRKPPRVRVSKPPPVVVSEPVIVATAEPEEKPEPSIVDRVKKFFAR